MSLLTAKTRQYATSEVGLLFFASNDHVLEEPTRPLIDRQRDPVEVLSTLPTFGSRPFARSSKASRCARFADLQTCESGRQDSNLRPLAPQARGALPPKARKVVCGKDFITSAAVLQINANAINHMQKNVVLTR